MTVGRPSMSATLARLVFAIVMLTTTWWILCEAMRERVPLYFGLALVALYMPLAMAVTYKIPRPAVTFGILIPLLVAIDFAVDAWIPYQPRFFLPLWQLIRVACLLVASAAVTNVKDPTPRMRQFLGTALVLALLLVGAVGACVVQIVIDGPHDESHRADGAIVLGFALDENGRAQPSLIARVDHGVDLYRRHMVPWLIMSGGAQPGQPTEGSVMRALAEARGVPASAIYTEEHSHSTVENFEFSASLIDSLRAHDVLLVTEPYHMPRSLFVARRFGLDLRPSPATESRVWREPRTSAYWVLRDAILLLAEYVRGPLIAAHRDLIK